MSKPVKLPTRKVLADDLAIELEGKVYYPHAGESVTFRPGRQTIQDAMLQLSALAIQKEVNDLVKRVEGVSAEVSDAEIENLLSKRQELQALVSEIITRLASRISSWTWTNNDGQPYPNPPMAETIRGLEEEEISWLRAQLNPKAKTEDELKNGSTPST